MGDRDSHHPGRSTGLISPHVTASAYGSWPTPITSALVTAAAARLGEVLVDGADVVWAESRPDEGGRTQLVRRTADGRTVELLGPGSSARTGVHEYGGAAWWVAGGVTWFTEWADQRLYRLDPDGTAEPITPVPASPRADRYADGELAPDGDLLVCVRERHLGPSATDVHNEIVRLDAHRPSEAEVLVSGPDFVAAPRLHPNGVTLAWLQWNHPSMPWDDVQLRTRNLITGEEIVVAGGPGESVSEPRWHHDGTLWFLSDRTDWWNLYRWRPGSDIESVIRADAEIGVPGWVFGSSRYAVLDDGRAVAALRRNGFDVLVVREPEAKPVELELPFSAVTAVCAAPGGQIVVAAGTPTSEPAVYQIDVGSGALATLRPPRELGVDPGYLSAPEPISFASSAPDGAARTGHALYYPPRNAEHTGPADELPPLLVVMHGGPTAAAVPVLSLAVQFWTSRGFAVVDVDYGGSTGYGRPYREELYGQWGVLDVTDCLAVAGWLAARRRADPARLCIRGGSAGGFTVLTALAREDTPFAAGADHCGVADLEALAAETHKFESRYLDRLVGPYPEDRDTYRARSPIHQVQRFRRPLIVLQGADDPIVPPAQSERIVDALRAAGVPVAYLLFPGEQHGFRRAENIRRALDAELSFYAQVLGFELPPAEGIEPVPVENL